MAIKKYNRSNFHKHTFCVFTEVPFTEIENKKYNYKSRSGSIYYFTDDGVYRLSDHWGRAAHCKWRLESSNPNTTKLKLGFALWTSFHWDNDAGKLYFINIDFSTGKVTYEHKDSGNYDGKALLRSASDTTKTIRQIRNLLSTESWAKYFEGDIAELRTKIIERMIATNLSLSEIKIAIRSS
jgi:hypothetical protein